MEQTLDRTPVNRSLQRVVFWTFSGPLGEQFFWEPQLGKVFREILAAAVGLMALGGVPNTIAAEGIHDDFVELGQQYQQHVRPLLQQFCLECHSTENQEGDLDLEKFVAMTEVRRASQVWVKVREMLANGEMPPEDSEQLSKQQRKQLSDWVQHYLHVEALAGAGDPGPVVLRRLNNAEYRYTVGDLTGIDLNPTREFPTDSAAGEGFTNTGNVLSMSPALLSKYLDAGKEIARHAVLLPDGFRFSRHTTTRDLTDDMLARIRGFYQAYVDTTKLGVGDEVGNVNVHGNTRIGLTGRLPLEKYFVATLAHRKALTSGTKTVETVAEATGLNAKYLGKLFADLTATEPSLLLDGLRERWREAKPDNAGALVAEVAGWQRGLWTFGPVGLIGRAGGRSRWMEPINPLVTQEELRYGIPAPPEGEDPRDVHLTLVVTDAGDGNAHDFVLLQRPRLVGKEGPDILLRDLQKTGLNAEMFGSHPNGDVVEDASLCVHAPATIEIRLPAEVAAGRELVTTAVLEPKTGGEGSAQVLLLVRDVHRTPVIQSGLFTSEVAVHFSQVVKLFSDHQEIIFRGPLLVSEQSTARRRIESAMDDYRSLFPAALCYSQIVPVDEVVTLRLFYREDDHLVRLMLDDGQQAELERFWEQLIYITQLPLEHVHSLELLLETLYDSGQYDAIEALQSSFNEQAEEFSKQMVTAESRQMDALMEFVARAYRRTPSPGEEEQLRMLYRRLREQDQSHEEAFRATLARVFMSAPFLYRLEAAPAGPGATWISDVELASRLSYFLWSSMPDHELRALAEMGRLTGHEKTDGVSDRQKGRLSPDSELIRQTQRMLKHRHVRHLATEFGCQWLHVYQFDPLHEKSEELFPEFTELRRDMYKEVIQFLTNLFQNDGSLLSLLNADHVFVNERLAEFYGVPWQATNSNDKTWHRVDGVGDYRRGGILALAAPLAKQSGATRTNPILRGNWLSEVLLGEKLPRPPQNVPELSNNVPEGLTERELIEKHSSEAACAKCHQRIDPYGFALENFDAIGRWRETDSSGLAIDSRTTLPDGTAIEGISGLRDYLLDNRRDVFIRHFCRKLLGYAVGREVQLSDQPLIDDIMSQLAKNDYRFSVAVEMIVSSDQFRKIRGKDH